MFADFVALAVLVFGLLLIASCISDFWRTWHDDDA